MGQRASTRLGLLAAAGWCALALGPSCASRSDAAFQTGGQDADVGGTDARVATDSATAPDTTAPAVDATSESSGPTAQLRIANWSPDAPTAGYDVCLAVHGTSSWSGPLLAQLVGDAGTLGDAAVASIQFPQMTNYLLAVAPATYDVAVVDAGAGCASPFVVVRDLTPLVLGDWYTMAIVGDHTPVGADPGLSVVVLADDSANAIGTGVRFLNVAPSLAAVDFGQGTLASGFEPLALGVAFATVAAVGAPEAGVTVDSNGYVGVAASSGVAFSAHGSTGATVDLAVASNLTLAPAPTATVALVGGKTGGAAPQLLVCLWDGVANESSGLLAPCSLGSM